MVYPKTICNEGNTYDYGVTSCGSRDKSPICSDSVRIDECSDKDKSRIFRNGMPPQIYIDLANYLERKEGCAGICNICPHPMYSDCSEGNFLPTCETKLADIMKSNLLIKLIENAGILTGISITGFIIGLVVINVLFCLCCHKGFGRKPQTYT